MDLFIWTEALATGNPSIDEDHQELVRRVNAVLESIARQQNGHALSAALRALVAHAKEHFASEEGEMKRIGFRPMHAHAAEHAKLLNQVQALQERLQAGARIDQMELYRLLSRWVKDHIREFDVELAAALAFKHDFVNGGYNVKIAATGLPLQHL